MRNRVEILRQIGIHHFGVAAAEQRVHLLDRVSPAPPRPVAVGRGIEIRLEDRLQHELGSGLHHPIPVRRDTERPFAATGLRDHHTPHRFGPVRLRDNVLPETAKPLLQPRRLDLREGDPVHPWRTPIGARQIVGMAQDVLTADLVVEQVEAERRLRLRLEIELPLKSPDTLWCLQAHRQSPILVFVESAPEVRVLPSAGITRPQRYHDPVRLPSRAAATCDVEDATSAPDGYPPITRNTLPTCRAHYPGGPKWVRASVASPSHAAFPVIQAGRRPHLTFEACSGFTRVTARQIARPPKAAFVTRLQPDGSPHQAARQLPELTDNSPGGTFLHWCSAPSGRTE